MGEKKTVDGRQVLPVFREKGWQDIKGFMTGTRKRSNEALDDDDIRAEQKRLKSETPAEARVDNVDSSTADPVAIAKTLDGTIFALQTFSDSPQHPQIFRGLNIYLNGSTAPLISDHKLKQLFAQHGGNASISLGRRTVTHVIIGDECGGGLASGKIEKEITTVGGKGIKFVTVQWVLDSIDKGIRQPEARYSPSKLRNKIGGSGQASVRSMFATKE